MFFQSYHKTTSNKNDEYNRIDTAAIAESQNALRTHQQQQQQYLAATRGAAFARPGLNNAPGRYNLLPLKSLANIFSNQILSLARFDGGSHGSCAEECEMAAQPAIEDEEQPRRLADERDLSAAESNEDFMKFTEIFNYLSEEEDFEPSSSSSSSPSPTPSTSPLSSTFSLSLSASNSSMSSLRAKTNVEQLNTQPDSASILNESVGKMDEDEKKMTGDMDTVSIDSLPLSSALSTSMMSVNTIASANSAGEYSSSLPATSTLAELPAAIASSEQPVEVEKPSLDLSSTEVYQKSLSTSTPALSSMTTQLSLTKPSPEFVVESVLNSPLKSKPIWSSALYLPCLHPALFELNSAHSVSCLTTTSNESKLVNPRKYDLTPQAPTPCVSWSCTLEANDFNPFNNKSTPSYVDQMNGVAEHNLKFLNENRFSAAAAFNPTNAYNADHNDFINFKSLAQLRNNLNFINKYFQSNYSQMNDFNRGYSQQQQQMMNEAEYDMSNNQTEMQADSAAEFGMNNFTNSNFNNRINSQNYNHAGGYFNSNYRSNAFNRSSKRRYRNNGGGGGYQFNQQYQSGSASYQHSQRNSLIIDDSTPAATNFYGHSSYESDSLPASNRHSMVIGGDGDFDVYKLKSNLKHGEEMGSLPSMLTNDEGLKTGSRSVESSSLDVHHKTNDDSQQQTNEFVDYSSGRTTSNKFLPPRFEKKWTDQYQPGSGFYSAQKDDMSVKNRNYSFRMSNNSNNSNNMSFNGKFFTMPAKKNSNNFNYNSQYNLNSSGNQQQQQQQQIMSTSLYGNGPTSASTSSSSSSPTSSPPTRHVLRRQNAIRLNHNQRYQHQNSNNNYQFSAKSLSTNSNNQFQQQASSNAAPSCQGPDCQPEQSYRYHHNHHQYNQMQSQQQPQQQQQQGNNANSRYRPQGQTSGMTASTGTANKTCRF